jgi:hypothetical protein
LLEPDCDVIPVLLLLPHRAVVTRQAVDVCRRNRQLATSEFRATRLDVVF